MRKVFSLSLFFIFLTSPALAQLDAPLLGGAFNLPPHANYQELETQNFLVVYPKEYTEEARYTAKVLEQLHQKLIQVFDYKPRQKVMFLLADNFDFANGVTLVQGHAGIVLFLNSPDPYYSIGEYDIWLKSLIIHEYAHWLSLEQTSGLFEGLRFLIGDIILPNSGWPRWLSEGLAVYIESYFTAQGRGHGTYYDTLTRDSLYRQTLGSKHFMKYDQVFGPYPEFPFGEAAYYMGFGIVEELLLEKGLDAPAKLCKAGSSRVPYFLDGTFEEINAPDTESLWNRWISREHQRMANDLDWLRENGAKDPEFFSEGGVTALGARFSPDGKTLAYVMTASGHKPPGLFLVDTSTRKPVRIDMANASAGVTFSPDGKNVFYSKQDFTGPYSGHNDLYSYNIEEKTTVRLTEKARAKDPDYCGNGKLVFTHLHGRFSSLALLDLNTLSIQEIYRAPEYHHISNPRCLNGKSVFFAEHGTEALDAIYVLDISNSSPRPRHIVGGKQDGFGALFPEPTQNGNLYFTKVKDSYYVLSRVKISGENRVGPVVTVSQSSGGYWMPSVNQKDPSKIAVSYVSSTGIRASVVNANEEESAFAKRPSHSHPKNPIAKQVLPQNAPALERTEESSYNLLTSLAPRFRIPVLTFKKYQSQFGINLVGWDNTDQFRYDTNVYYDTAATALRGNLNTTHRFLGLEATLSGSKEVGRVFDTSIGRLNRDDEVFGVGISRPFPGYFLFTAPRLNYSWIQNNFINRSSRKSVDLFTSHVAQAGLVVASPRIFPYSLTYEQGGIFQGDVAVFKSGRTSAWKALLSQKNWFSLFPEHSSLRLGGFAGIAPAPVSEIPVSPLSVGGRGGAFLDPPLRGYPVGNFESIKALVFQAEYAVPFGQIFRGLGTFPFFMQNFGGYVFYDGAKLQEVDKNWSPIFSGVGGGLMTNFYVFYHQPVHIAVEIARGLSADRGGESSIALVFTR